MKNKAFNLTLILISISILFYHGFNMFYLWSDIPDRIAIHFSNGESDNWGSKYFLLVMPILSIFIWFIFQILVRKPEKLNYVNLTEENKEIQYSKAEKVMLLIQNLSTISLVFANEAFLRSAVGMETGWPYFIAIASLAICLFAPFYLLFWAARLKY